MAPSRPITNRSILSHTASRNGKVLRRASLSAVTTDRVADKLDDLGRQLGISDQGAPRLDHPLAVGDKLVRARIDIGDAVRLHGLACIGLRLRRHCTVALDI